MSQPDERDIIRRPISGGSISESELPLPVVVRGNAARAESPFAQAVRRLRKSVTAVVGFVIVMALLFVALFADVLAPQSPITSDQTHTFERPSLDYPLGTDQLGRDMLSRVIHGTRISLAVGVSSVLLALFVGVPFGLIAGYYGGRLDSYIMRVMDLILAFPIYLLAIILMVIFTPTAGLIGTIKVVGAIAIVRIPIYARLVRGSVLSIKEKEYIEASRAVGVRDPVILLRHVLPNCLAPIIVTTTPGHRHLDHRGGHAVVPRARHAAPDAELGVGPQGQRVLHPGQCVALAVPRAGHLRDRPRLQPVRRRPPRRPRPKAEVDLRRLLKTKAPA